MSNQQMKSDQYQIFGMYDTYTLKDLISRLKEVQDYVIEHQKADPNSIRFSLDKIWDAYDPEPSIQFCATFNRPETDKEQFDRIEQENRNKKYQEERDRKEYERLQKQFRNQ